MLTPFLLAGVHDHDAETTSRSTAVASSRPVPPPCGLTTLPDLLRRRGEEGRSFGGFTLGVQSYTFRKFDLEQALKRIQELGLHYVEFYQKHAPLASTPGADHGHPQAVQGVRRHAAGLGRAALHQGTRRQRKVFEFGKALGIKMFSADPDPDSFDSLDKLCDEYKIAIGIHPHGPRARTSCTAGTPPRSS